MAHLSKEHQKLALTLGPVHDLAERLLDTEQMVLIGRDPNGRPVAWLYRGVIIHWVLPVEEKGYGVFEATIDHECCTDADDWVVCNWIDNLKDKGAC